MNKKNKDILHLGFEIGLFFKSLIAMSEIISGTLLIFINTAKLRGIVNLFTQGELAEDPKDIIANLLMALSNNFSVSTQNFSIFYLLSHGIVKITIIILLWKRKIWAYPLGIALFSFFIVYQIYRYTFTHSIFLILLTAIDFIMVFLTLVEYKKQKISN